MMFQAETCIQPCYEYDMVYTKDVIIISMESIYSFLLLLRRIYSNEKMDFKMTAK